METPQRKFLGPVIRKAAQDILNFQAQQQVRPTPGSRHCECGKTISANALRCGTCQRKHEDDAAEFVNALKDQSATVS